MVWASGVRWVVYAAKARARLLVEVLLLLLGILGLLRV